MVLALTPSSRAVAGTLCCAAAATAVAAGAPAGESRGTYRFPRGEAAAILAQFATECGRPILFMMDAVRGEQTNALNGTYTPREALDRLLAGTALVAVQDPKSGGFIIHRRPAPSQKEQGESGRSRGPPAAQPTPPPETPKTAPTKPKEPPPVKNRTLIALVAGWLAAGAPSQAQTANSPAKEEAVVLSPFSISASAPGRFQATEATSGGRVRVSLMDSTQSVSVITRDLIQDIGAGRVIDAAKYVAGITESTIPNSLDRTTMRGFQAEGYTIDGFTYSSYNNMDPVLVERIEIVKGPNPILAPQGIPGGTINSVSKKPIFANSATVSLQAGRYDANRAELDFNRVLVPGKAAFRLVASREDSHHLADGNFKDQTLAMPMFTWRLSPGTSFTAQTLLVNFTGGAYGGLPVDPYVGTNDKAVLIRGVPRSLDLYTRDAYRHSAGHITRFLLTSVVNDQLSIRLASSLHHLSFDNAGPSFSLVGPLPVTRNENTGEFAWNGVARNDAPLFNVGGSDGYGRLRKIEVQNDYLHRLQLGGMEATTLAGFTYAENRDQFRSNSYSRPQIAIRNFTYVPPTRNGTRISSSINDGKTFSAYAGETLSLLQGTLKINGGVARVAYDRANRDTLATTRRGEIKPRATLPSAGVLFKPVPNLSLFAGYSRQATPSFVSFSFIPSRQTELQTSKQWEVGARIQLLDQRLYGSVVYYDIKQDNFSVPNPANAAVPTPNPLFPPLLSDRMAHGVEVELTYVISKSVSIVANGTSLRNRDRDNVPFRGTPEKSAAAWLSYTGTKGSALADWSFGAGLDHLAKRPGDLAQAFTSLSTPARLIRQQPSFYLPARTLLNVKIGYRISSKWVAQLNVDNLSNEEYLAASTARNTVFPGTPVNPKLRVTYTF